MKSVLSGRPLVASVLAVLVIGMMYQFATLYHLENNLMDRILRETRPVDARIIIVGIEEESLAQLGQWPWPRSVHARLIDRLHLAGARAIGVDLLFTEHSADPVEDKALRRSISNKDNVILVQHALFPQRQEQANQLRFEQWIPTVIPAPAEQLAHINVLADRDGVVRHILLGLPAEEKEAMVPALSVRMANFLLPKEEQIRFADGAWRQGLLPLPVNERQQVQFVYAQPPGGFTMIPYVTALQMEETALQEIFRDAVVLIGPYTAGMQDQYWTPMSTTTPMYGVEIHANMMQSLQDGRFYQTLGDGKASGWALIIGLFLLTAWWMRKVRPALAPYVLAIVMLLYVVGFILLYIIVHLLLPLSYPLLAIIAAGVLAIAERYVAERRERQRITTLFGRYVSPVVVEEILRSHQAQQLGGARRQVTILFADIRGFTALAEKAAPEEVIEWLNQYLDLCTRAVFQQQGTLDKFIGDGVMAIFGAPMPQEDHALRAVRAAMQMQQEGVRLAEQLDARFGYTISFGIGIHTGDAIIGNIGAKNRLDYTAVGDTVNLAARLEAHAAPGQVLISQATYDQVQERVETAALGRITVKNRERPVQLYEVRGEKETI